MPLEKYALRHKNISLHSLYCSSLTLFILQIFVESILCSVLFSLQEEKRLTIRVLSLYKFRIQWEEEQTLLIEKNVIINVWKWYYGRVKNSQDNSASGQSWRLFVGKHMSRISLLLSYISLLKKKLKKKNLKTSFFSHITFYSHNCAFFFFTKNNLFF